MHFLINHFDCLLSIYGLKQSINFYLLFCLNFYYIDVKAKID